MKYKILFVCNSYPPHLGGAEKVCKNAVEILKEAGYNVTVLTQYCAERKDKTGVVELASSTVYSYMPKLAEYLNTHDFDLYISFGYGKYFTDYIGYWCKKHNKKSVVMPCGSFHTSSNFLLKKLYAAAMTRWSLNNYSCRVVATQWEKDFWCNKFGVRRDNTFVIPYNLEKDFTKFKETKILKKYGLKKKQYLLYLGRAGPNKLTALLKDSYNLTSKELPLVIGGKGNPDFNFLPTTQIALQNFTAADRLHAKVNYNILSMGAISEDDKKTLIAGAKLCIFPTNYESFGLSAAEAVVLKTPVIVSNLPVFKCFLHDERIFFNNNIDDLSRLIELRINNPIRIKDMDLGNYKKSLLGVINNVIHGD